MINKNRYIKCLVGIIALTAGAGQGFSSGGAAAAKPAGAGQGSSSGGAAAAKPVAPPVTASSKKPEANADTYITERQLLAYFLEWVESNRRSKFVEYLNGYFYFLATEKTQEEKISAVQTLISQLKKAYAQEVYDHRDYSFLSQQRQGIVDSVVMPDRVVVNSRPGDTEADQMNRRCVSVPQLHSEETADALLQRPLTLAQTRIHFAQ